MRGKRAKVIRREVYGDYAHGTRNYGRNREGAIVNLPDSLRAKYLKAKEEYKNGTLCQ